MDHAGGLELVAALAKTAGTAVNERWYSDDLQALVKSSNNDPRFGLNTYELTNIEQGDPEPALFQPPAGYTITQRNH